MQRIPKHSNELQTDPTASRNPECNKAPRALGPAGPAVTLQDRACSATCLATG